MRILFFSNVFPNPHAPGKGPFNRALVGALSEQHTLCVMSPVSWVDEAAARIKSLRPAAIARRLGRLAARTMPQYASGCDSRRFDLVDGVLVEYPRFWYPPKVLRSTYHAWMWKSVNSRLRSAIESFRPDAVLSYWTHPDGAVAVRAAHQAGLPAIVMVGGSDVLLLGRNGRRACAVANVLRCADAVVAVSDDLAQRIRDVGAALENVHVVRRGIDANLFRPGDRSAARAALGIDLETKAVISVGRLVQVKGHAVLIEACRRLVGRGFSFQCHLLGEGPLRAELTQQIRRAGLHHVVQLPGNQSPKRLGDWYRAADMTVAPSFSEGVPNVLLESVACGTPFVASAVGGIPEIADERFDRLVPAGDATALADAIQQQLAAPRISGRRRYEPATWQESAAQLVGVIDECCSRIRLAQGLPPGDAPRSADWAPPTDRFGRPVSPVVEGLVPSPDCSRLSAEPM